MFLQEIDKNLTLAASKKIRGDQIAIQDNIARLQASSVLIEWFTPEIYGI